MAFEYNIMKFDFFDTAVADIIRAIEGRSLMGAFILSFCCIDYMGMGLNPDNEKNTSGDFKDFLRNYMVKLDNRYADLADELWAVRNSLIHTYGQSSATKRANLGISFHHEVPQMHLRVNRRGQYSQIHFNLPDFVSDLVSAIEIYFRENEGDTPKLRKWYSKLIIVRSIDAIIQRFDSLHSQKPLHTRSHNMLGVLDADPLLDVEEIRDHIREEINKILNNDKGGYPYPVDNSSIDTTHTSTGTTVP